MDTLIKAAAEGSYPAAACIIAIVVGVCFVYWVLFGRRD